MKQQRKLLKGPAKSPARLRSQTAMRSTAEVHSLIAQGSQNSNTLITSESLHETGRKNKERLCAKELDKMEITARTGSMRTMKGQ